MLGGLGGFGGVLGELGAVLRDLHEGIGWSMELL